VNLDLDLHPKQGEAFLSPATEILYGGAAGGGKSHLMRVAAIAWCAAVPGLQVYLFRRTFPDLMKNHMNGPGSLPMLLARWITAGLAKVNRSDNFISFFNGSKIFLCHCQYESSVTKYQGAEMHVLLIDELTHFSRTTYTFLRSRVRLGGLFIPDEHKDRFPRIILGSNPGGIGHNWVKADFVDPAPALEIRKMPKIEGGMLRQFVPARVEDNPTLMRNDPGYLERLEGLGDPGLVRAMRRGEWDIVAGGLFDDLWNPECHVLKSFQVPDTWRIDRSFDWGSSRPFSVGWWAESDGSEFRLADGSNRTFQRGTLIRIGEWYGWNGRPNEGCRALASDIAKGILEKEIDMNVSVHPGPADSSIFDAVNGNSIGDEMAKHGVRWVPADKSPGTRKAGWEMMRKMLKAASERRPESPGLYVFDTCRHFIRTVPTLPRYSRDPDDADTNAEDHVADEVRYRVLNKRRAIQTLKLQGS